MKCKIIFTAVLTASLLTALGGCDLSELSFDDILRPPKSMGDEAEIEQLISETAGQNYTLKYPKSGSYRSAIIMSDLDGDDTDEAIAFFREKDDVTGIHMLVMYEDEGTWKISDDFVTETTDVDCVDFADINETDSLEILVGYTTYTPNINFLSCYTYKDGRTNAIQSGQNYTAFHCGNLDGKGKSEVVTFSLFNAENAAKATMLEYDESRKRLYAKANAEMDPNVVKYKNITFSDLGGGVKGIIVDGTSASEETYTQVIYYNQELSLLRNPLYIEKVRNATIRTCSVISADIDNDLAAEIPTVEKLPSFGAEMSQIVADKITWNTFDTEHEELVPKISAAADYNYNYTIKMPDIWLNNSVTALHSESDTSVTSFYEWNGTELGDKLFDIKVFEVSRWDQGKDNDDYRLIYKDNRYAYTFNNINTSSPFSMTDDEIKTAFSLLSGASV